MKNSSDKEKILKVLRTATLDIQTQISIPEITDEIYRDSPDPVMSFAEKVSEEGGKFVYCRNEEEMLTKLKNLISYRKWNKIRSSSQSLWSYLDQKGIETSLEDEKASVGISLCQGIVARSGSIVLTSAQGIGGNIVHFPPVFIVIAFTTQMFNSYRHVLNLLSETPPQWVLSIRSGKFISEEIKELYLFVIEA